MAKKDLMKLSEEEIAKMEEEVALEQLAELEAKQKEEEKAKTKKEVKEEKAYVILPKAYQRWLGPVYAFTLNGVTFALRVDGTKNEVDPKYKDWIDRKMVEVLQSVQREDIVEQL